LPPRAARPSGFADFEEKGRRTISLPIEPGGTLLHYRHLEKIGKAGMGVVWKATDTTLNARRRRRWRAAPAEAAHSVQVNDLSHPA
jgi:hypothetical protein